MRPALKIITQLQNWGCTSADSSLQFYVRQQNTISCMKGATAMPWVHTCVKLRYDLNGIMRLRVLSSIKHLCSPHASIYPKRQLYVQVWSSRQLYGHLQDSISSHKTCRNHVQSMTELSF